ncbi:hypothetical protein GCM10009790_31850 [Georgenia ruanii]
MIVAAALEPLDVASHLAAATVVARLEWYPGTEHLLSIALLTDAAGRVARNVDDALEQGPAAADLADALTAAFDVDVLMEGVPARRVAGEAPGPAGVGAAEAAGAAGPADAEAAALPVVTEEDVDHDARTVVLTPMPAHQAPLHATLLERTVTVLEQPVAEETRRLLVTTGPGRELGVLGWDADAYPVLRLQVDAEDRTALLLPGPEVDDDEPEGTAVFSWAMQSLYVYGGATGAEAPEVRELAHELLGDGADAAAFAAAVPGADPDAVAAALRLRGADGLAAFVAALGLPAAVTEVLEGRTSPADLPGAVVHEPARLDKAAATAAKIAFESSVPGRAVREPAVQRRLLRGAVAAVGALAAGAALSAVVRRTRR